jgi:hypothetical protein
MNPQIADLPAAFAFAGSLRPESRDGDAREPLKQAPCDADAEL